MRARGGARECTMARERSESACCAAQPRGSARQGEGAVREEPPGQGNPPRVKEAGQRACGRR
eukprot:10430272-Lingulodinium_polyedra.AAC.1